MDIAETGQDPSWMPVFGIRPRGLTEILPPFNLRFHWPDRSAEDSIITEFLGKSLITKSMQDSSSISFQIVEKNFNAPTNWSKENYIGFLRRVSLEGTRAPQASNTFEGISSVVPGGPTDSVRLASRQLIDAMEFVNSVLDMPVPNFPQPLQPIDDGECMGARIVAAESIDGDLVALQFEIRTSEGPVWRTWGDVVSIENGREIASRYTDQCITIFSKEVS